jgi:hypothetical protein
MVIIKIIRTDKKGMRNIYYSHLKSFTEIAVTLYS